MIGTCKVSIYRCRGAGEMAPKFLIIAQEMVQMKNLSLLVDTNVVHTIGLCEISICKGRGTSEMTP